MGFGSPEGIEDREKRESARGRRRGKDEPASSRRTAAVEDMVIVVAAALAIELVEAATAIPVDNTIANLCTWSSSGKTGMTNPTDLEPSAVC
jgi:hypothetical protein